MQFYIFTNKHRLFNGLLSKLNVGNSWNQLYDIEEWISFFIDGEYYELFRRKNIKRRNCQGR